MKWGMFIVGVCLFVSPALVFGENLAVNAGFEIAEATGGGWPTSLGDWKGDYSEIVRAAGEVIPYEGERMLRFKGTSFNGAAGSDTSEIFQLVDLSSYTSLIASGNATAKASAFFNRVNTDSQTDTGFQVHILAYNGLVSTFASRWESGEYSSTLAYATASLISDGLINTWEKTEATLVIPTNTTFLAIAIKAYENIYNDSITPEFDGHFADAVSIEIIPEPATILLLLAGGITLKNGKKQ